MTNSPRQRLSASNRRAQLLEVAMSVFADGGFASTTMEEIAHRAGVTKPVLYQHFPSKAALYRELLATITAEVSAAILGAASDADGPRDQVVKGFTAFFSYVSSHNPEFLLLYDRTGWHDAHASDPVHSIEDELIERIDPLIDAGLHPMHRRVLAAAVVSMAEGVGRRWLVGGPPVAPEVMQERSEGLANVVAQLAWSGLRGIEPTAADASPDLSS